MQRERVARLWEQLLTSTPRPRLRPRSCSVRSTRVRRTRRHPPASLEELTDRELVVLRYLATMRTNDEIASDLYVSVNTVKAHLKRAFRKLGVDSRREAVRRARELGLIGDAELSDEQRTVVDATDSTSLFNQLRHWVHVLDREVGALEDAHEVGQVAVRAVPDTEDRACLDRGDRLAGDQRGPQHRPEPPAHDDLVGDVVRRRRARAGHQTCGSPTSPEEAGPAPGAT